MIQSLCADAAIPVMSEPAPNPELMRSLGRLVRGLSALFWGLPVALVVCFYTARAEGFKSFGVIPPLVTTGLLAYGLWQMADFQRQERVWRRALDRARVLSLINAGLSPFLYWWYRVPANAFFSLMVLTQLGTGLLFLAFLNLALRRLGAMLPDEGLQQETMQFTRLNLNLLGAITLIGMGYIVIINLRELPWWLAAILPVLDRGNLSMVLMLLLILLPVAMSMALIWKTKEVILEGIFRAG
jgi:hypothetical protein